MPHTVRNANIGWPQAVGAPVARATEQNVDERRGILRQTALSERVDCDRTVIRQARNLEEHRGLQTYTEESFWRANSLIAYALTCLGVARCRSTSSLSKRAPSTTRTSLRLESTRYERSEQCIAKRSFNGDFPPMRFVISSLRTHSKPFGAEIV